MDYKIEGKELTEDEVYDYITLDRKLGITEHEIAENTIYVHNPYDRAAMRYQKEDGSTMEVKFYHHEDMDDSDQDRVYIPVVDLSVSISDSTGQEVIRYDGKLKRAYRESLSDVLSKPLDERFDPNDKKCIEAVRKVAEKARVDIFEKGWPTHMEYLQEEKIRREEKAMVDAEQKKQKEAEDQAAFDRAFTDKINGFEL